MKKKEKPKEEDKKGKKMSESGCLPTPEREFFIDSLLVRIHLIIEMILVDRPCAMGGGWHTPWTSEESSESDSVSWSSSDVSMSSPPATCLE